MTGADSQLAALAPAFENLERALARDGSHVIVAGGSDAQRSLFLGAIPAQLAAPLRAFRVSLSGAVDEEICARILRALGREPGLRAEEELRAVIADLVVCDGVLVLLVDDAASLHPDALERLGSLATAARPHLRLVLAVGSAEGSGEAMADGSGEAVAVASVVSALGLGAEKIELGRQEARVAPSLAGAPRAPRPPQRAPKPKRAVSSAEQPAPRRRTLPRSRAARLPRALPVASAAAAIALLAAALPNLITEHVTAGRGELPAVATRPVALEPARESAAPPAAPRPPPALPAPEASEPVAAPEPRAPAPPPEPRPAAASPKPRPPAASPAVHTVAVNLNARPWARIEVDGRDVGITPLAKLPLAAGPHRFRAHFADGRVIERTVSVDSHRNRVTFP